MTHGPNPELMIRLLTASDMDACMHLKNAAGWNQTPEDWQLVLRLNPEGCFAGEVDGRVVGTAVVVEYGTRLSWIGMVLVDPDFRRHGFGRRLMDQAMARAGARTALVMLDASIYGQPLYHKLGFRDTGGVARLTGHARLDAAPEGVVPMRDTDLAAVAAMDRTAFGADRRALIEALFRRRPGSAWVRCRNGRIVAFCLGRDGTRCEQVGPVVAETAEDARSVAQAALNGSAAQFDVPESQGEFLCWLTGAGFTVQRTFSRMVLGEATVPGKTARLFAAAGPEFG